MSTCVLKALPGNLDIKRHSPSILYLQCKYNTDALFGIKHYTMTCYLIYKVKEVYIENSNALAFVTQCLIG